MGVADGSARRTVTVERIAWGVFTATSTGGGQLSFGTGGDTGFTPAELLLAAIAGCTTIDVGILTSRRARTGQLPGAGRRGQGPRCSWEPADRHRCHLPAHLSCQRAR
jgi:hypothetical protein